MLDVKVSKSTKNQPQLPDMVEKSDTDSPVEQNAQDSNDSGGCVESKSDDEVDALDSGSPAPAAPSNGICESDNRTAAVNPEVENKQKESCSNSKSSPTPAESNKSSGIEHKLPDPPTKGNADPCATDNASKTKAPSLESVDDSSSGKSLNALEASGIKSPVTLESSDANVSEDALPTKRSVCETSEHSTQDIVNGKPGPASSPSTIISEEPLQQFNPISAADADHKAHSEVRTDLVVSDVVQEDLLPAEEADKPSEESETPHLVDGKVASPISS